MTNATPPTSDPNKPLISGDLMRKIEMQHLQLALETRFQKNMALFKQTAKDIYDQFIDYQPEELRLLYTAEGYLNLVNYQLHNKPVYPQEPKVFTQEQIDNYVKKPSISSITFAKSKHHNPSHIHIPLVNSLIDTYEGLAEKVVPKTDVPIGSMLMTGCGLGYQLEYFVDTLDIYTLIIFDPHKDSFYASLHIIDWEKIIRYFLRKGRMIKLLIGVEPTDAMATLKVMTDKIGLHNLVYTFLYRHFNSPKEEEFVQMYKKEFHLNATGTGFFDDERTSFAHTIANLNSKATLFKEESSAKGLPPAFVLGNGPSLDTHIEYIRQHHENAIIFTCGTSISSLFKTGMKPDFHVEMERVSETTGWIIHGTTPEYRKDVTLLCLNTAPPNMVEIFDEVCMAKKPNDLGESIIDDVIGDPRIKPLLLCNPTVVNAGLTFAISMGFKEIYLFGVDLGLKGDGGHHSKLSLYYDLERKTKQGGHTSFEQKIDNYTVKGNLGGEIFTNPILHSTQTNLEVLLRHTQRTIGDVTCYNSNDGAYIDGTQSITPEGLPSLPAIANKPEIIKQLKSEHILKPEIPLLDSEAVQSRYIKHFFNFLEEIKIADDIDNIWQLHAELNRIYYHVNQQKNKHPTTVMLLRGSINAYFTLMFKACLFVNDQEEFKQHLNEGRATYMEFIEQAHEVMSTCAMKHDDTPDRGMKNFEEEPHE